MKKIIVLTIVIGLLLSTTPISMGDVGKKYTPHDPITIIGDDDFTQENGITGGSGTIGDPYIISGWEVENITIKFTSKHFRVKDCYIIYQLEVIFAGDNTCVIEKIESPTNETNDAVIRIGNTKGVIIRNCDFENFRSIPPNAYEGAIHINNCEDIIIENCSFLGVGEQNIDGERIFGIVDDTGSTNTEIRNCNFENCYVAVMEYSPSYIHDCIFTHCDDEGIFTVVGATDTDTTLIEDCDFIGIGTYDMGIEAKVLTSEAPKLIIRGCTFYNILDAIQLMICKGAIIEDCIIHGGSTRGIIIEDDEIIIRNNIIKDCIFGLRFRYTTHGAQIYNNTFFECGTTEPSPSGGAISFDADPYNNLFYNNKFENNTLLIYEAKAGVARNQTWNISKTLGTNIIGGPYLGGNYWDNYTGNDTNGDGLGDTETPFLGLDYLPLTNFAPDAPTITGETNGEAGVEYEYTFVSTDDNNDDVYYYIDWDDGTNTSWIGPYPSGEEITLNHTWSEQGTYEIKAKAKDVRGSESDWATLPVTMPLNQITRRSTPRSSQQSTRQTLQTFKAIKMTTR